ncbi:PE family protein PE27A, partial [Mycobacterium tuberculosis TKK-01-0008]
LTARLAAAH